jgi:hypothetical protein
MVFPCERSRASPMMGSKDVVGLMLTLVGAVPEVGSSRAGMQRSGRALATGRGGARAVWCGGLGRALWGGCGGRYRHRRKAVRFGVVLPAV